MTLQTPQYQLTEDSPEQSSLLLSGDWVQGQDTENFSALQSKLRLSHPIRLVTDGSSLGNWDSILMAFLLQCYNHCRAEGIEFQTVFEMFDFLVNISSHFCPAGN